MAYYDSHAYNLQAIGPEGPYGPLVGQRMDGRGVLGGGPTLGQLGGLGVLGHPEVMGRPRRSLRGYDEDLAAWNAKKFAYETYLGQKRAWDAYVAAWNENQALWRDWYAKDQAYQAAKASLDAQVAAWSAELAARERYVGNARKDNAAWAKTYGFSLPTPPGTSVCTTAADRSWAARMLNPVIKGLGDLSPAFRASAPAALVAKLAPCPAWAPNGPLATNMPPRPTASLPPVPVKPPAAPKPPLFPGTAPGTPPIPAPDPGPPPVRLTSDAPPPGTPTLPLPPAVMPAPPLTLPGITDGSGAPLPAPPGSDCASRGMSTAPDGTCIPRTTEPADRSQQGAGGLGSTGLLLLLAAAGGAAYWYSTSKKKGKR